MAELDTTLFFPGLESIVVDVDMLDFTYVERCSDWLKLAKILQILKSGKEGYYPEVFYIFLHYNHFSYFF
jgi:hypothetical protein